MSLNKSWIRRFKTIISMNKYFEHELCLRHEHEMYVDFQNNPELFDIFILRKKMDKAAEQLNFKELYFLIDIYKQQFLKKETAGNLLADDKDNPLVHEKLTSLFDEIQDKMEVIKDVKVTDELIMELEHIRRQKATINESSAREAEHVKQMLDLMNEGAREEVVIEEKHTNLDQDKNLLNVIKYSVAACLLFLISFGSIKMIAPQAQSQEEIFSQYYQNLPDFYMVRADHNLAQVQQLYYQGKYKEAYSMINSIPGKDQNISKFFKGLLALELGNYTEAVECLEDVAAKKSYDNYAITVWYLGLAYLKTNENEKAKEAFAKIADHDVFKQKEARKILRVMPD
ncbi:MAG: hypothetical protein MI922_25050 [Bacteroidales bacterium]|nr:hypothetical protein [Bacteroidales bacterium]